MGIYDITLSGLTSDNYEITFVKGTLSIAAKQPTPIARPQLTANNVVAYAAHNAIVLQNLPKGKNVQIYNLKGEQTYFANSENSQILRIPVQTKGMYIVKVNHETLRIAVK